MLSNIVVRALNLSKEYLIYNTPQKRLQEILSMGKKKFHRKIVALNHMSFQISEGTCVGIVGGNGSGKSTLLQMIAGTLHPTSGNIEVKGKIAALLELGSGFNPEFTGRENIYLYSSIMQMSRKEVNARIEEIISFADIGDFIDNPIKTYSSGMHVRLAFSAAIHTNPDILIIDEALSVGDAAFKLKCFDKIGDIKSKGKTIIFVSHDINAVTQFCDRVLVLSKGQFIYDGSPIEAINIYKSMLFSGKKGEYAKKKTVDKKPLESEKLNLNRYEHRFGNGEAIISEIRLINSANKDHQVFFSNEQILIKIFVKAISNIKHPIYGIIIKNKDGLQVYGKNSLHQHLSCPPIHKEKIQEVHFRLSLFLNANDYFLTVGVSEYRQNEMVHLDRRSDAVQFKVVGTEECIGIANLNSVIEIK